MNIKQGKFWETYNTPNYIKIPVTTTSNLEEWNAVYKYWRSLEMDYLVDYGIKRTKSGGISIKNKQFRHRYEVKTSSIGCELLVLGGNRENDWCAFRLQFRTAVGEDSNGETMSGRTCFQKFVKELEKDGIDISDYYIKDGMEVKKTIEAPMIAIVDGEVDKVYENSHHIDIHSSFPSGFVDMYPEWSNTVERIYDGRKINPENKLILNATWGYFQTKFRFGAKLAHVSKHAIERNNRRIKVMTEYLQSRGAKVLLHNTDGIWFQGNIDEMNIQFGKKLGDWDIDHTNCTLRIKTKGAYEFIENGKYHPVLRGKTRLDKIKPRNEWKWGDIYEASETIIQYRFVAGKGIINTTKGE